MIDAVIPSVTRWESTAFAVPHVAVFILPFAISPTLVAHVIFSVAVEVHFMLTSITTLIALPIIFFF
jgi:hypothetical protein